MRIGPATFTCRLGSQDPYSNPPLLRTRKLAVWGPCRRLERLQNRRSSLGEPLHRARSRPPTMGYVFTCKLLICESEPACTRTRDLFLSEKHDTFKEVSRICKIPANIHILELTLYPSFRNIDLGCCAVATQQRHSKRLTQPYNSRHLKRCR